MDIELLKIKVDIWKQVINTQQHFNDLGMKIRNFAILILSAFIGAIGVSFKSGYSMPIFGYPTSVSTILSFGAALIWLLFFFVDVYWYHPLLVGAVKKGMDIEKNIGDELKDIINLTHYVGKESPVKIRKLELHSKHKAKVFYLGVFSILIFSSVFLIFLDTPEKKDKPEVLNRFESLTLTCKRTLNYDGVECVFK
ncbi:hypothetical protein [Pectobacterium carotovorum]|uniref:hypothetical protein n=1 Tax=Pectobacterium carotovorum TaxID=554 RepID=UPI00057F1382|nr:hypothetical protein [Pectobacterium carotovorum]KHT31883.1 hypothetical protein RD01_09405 [Pectobacterium carotovorum subsp. carotovorum]